MKLTYVLYAAVPALSLMGETPELASLPSPYNELTELLPFNSQGWYSNGKYLQHILHAIQAKTVIEVGSFLGSSTRHIASCLPEGGKVYAVDHWEGSIEHRPEGGSPSSVPLNQLYDYFLSNTIHAHLTDKIIPYRSDSLAAARTLDVQADLIFIDAAHDTESVYNDLRAWFPRLRPGGILCGDDWWGESVKTAVLRFAQEHMELALFASENFYCFFPIQGPRIPF